MAEVVRYALEDDSTVLVEVDDDSYGLERVARGSDGIVDAGRRLEQSLGQVSGAAEAALGALRPLASDGIEIEFGIKLAGEAGAMIAKSSIEGHFNVKLSWSRRAEGS